MRLGNYTFNSRYSLIVMGLVLMLTAACTPTAPSEQSAGVATDTLAPLVTFTPRFTATAVPSRTPLPTFTLTPSDTPISPTPSNTPTASATPPVTGIVASINTVNVREGPSAKASAIDVLTPGTGVQILATSPDGKWLNIRMDNSREGWIAAELVRVNPRPTEFPTATPSPNLTALAQGTLLPTAVLGGGTITPTPPRSVTTPTEVGSVSASNTPASSAVDGTLPPLPVIDTTAINLTATAMALPTSTATFTPVGADTATPSIPFVGITFTPSAGNTNQNTASGNGNKDIGALCDDPSFGVSRPTNVTTQTLVKVFWAWYATSTDLIQQHINNVTYEVSIDGVISDNLKIWQQYGIAIRKEGNLYAKYWYVPIDKLTAGQHVIRYRATWSQAISDGIKNYGPGTANEQEIGSCTFTVAP